MPRKTIKIYPYISWNGVVSRDVPIDAYPTDNPFLAIGRPIVEDNRASEAPSIKVSGSDWVLTHIPTGMSVVRTRTIKDATAFLAELMALPFPVFDQNSGELQELSVEENRTLVKLYRKYLA